MFRLSDFRAFLAAIAFAPAIVVAAGDTTPHPELQPTTTPSLMQAIDRLAAVDPSDRAAAENELAATGKSSIPALESALNDPRPEVRSRARQALRRIHLFSLPHFPDQALHQADVYLKQNDAAQRALLLDHLQVMSPASDAVMVRLYSLEPNDQLREQMRDRLGNRYRDVVSGLIADDDDSAALLPLLESAARKAAAERQHHEAEADYAALLSQTGGLDDQIERWNAELANAAPATQPAIASVLCYLYRISGKSDQALAMARRTQEQSLVFLVLQDQSAWEAATHEMDNRWSSSITAAGIRTGYQRLAGHLDDVAATLSPFADSPPDPNGELSPSKIFLLNDQPVRGIESMMAAHPAAVCRMLIDRYEYNRALEITQKYKDDPNDRNDLAQLHDDLQRTLGLVPTNTAAAAAPNPDETETPFAHAVMDLKRRDFAKAAGEFGALWQQDSTQCDRLYLQGYTLDSAGDHKRGQKLMQQALLIPLGDPLRRWAMSVQLDAAGLTDVAEAQRSLALRSGAEFDEIGFSEIFNTRAELASERKQWQRAAEMYDRLCLINLSPNVFWHDPARYLTVPALAHLDRARMLRDQHSLPAAMNELRLYQEYLPTDSAMAIEWTLALDGLGEHALADEIFNPIFDRLDGLCTKYPRSASLNNQIAWLTACTSRKLDLAATHAVAATSLDQGNWQYQDTLAEVRFRQGDRPRAVELERQAATTTNDAGYCARQIRRFNSAEIPTSTQPGPEPQ